MGWETALHKIAERGEGEGFVVAETHEEGGSWGDNVVCM